MAFTIRFCPYCGSDVSLDESGSYVCSECEKRIARSRSNTKAFLLNKPYEEEYSKIIGLIDDDPEKALEMIESIMDGEEEPTSDMYFTRGIVYAAMGEEGKAHVDWKKGLDAMTDLRFIDYYIVAICKRIVELICMKEREFMDFNPIEYIDNISTEFKLKGNVPCKGIFYITIYRNFKMDLQAGKFNDEQEMYNSIILKILHKILAYGRNFRTTCSIIEEVAEDFEYNPETYEEDDNLRLHLCITLANKYNELSKDFSEEHLLRIFRHWNDENMFELEYWVDQLKKSITDSTILLTLRRLRLADEGDFDLDTAVEYYARKYLLISETGEDLSEKPQVLEENLQTE